MSEVAEKEIVSPGQSPPGNEQQPQRGEPANLGRSPSETGQLSRQENIVIARLSAITAVSAVAVAGFFGHYADVQNTSAKNELSLVAQTLVDYDSSVAERASDAANDDWLNPGIVLELSKLELGWELRDVDYALKKAEGHVSNRDFLRTTGGIALLSLIPGALWALAIQRGKIKPTI